MELQKISGYQQKLSHELHTSVMPFWERVSYDEEYGGIRHFAGRDGTLYSTVKGGWFQGRGTWTFARMYNRFGKQEKHLEMARSGYRFLVDKCFDYDGRMFFELEADGTPLRKRRYWYGEAFAVMGMAEYAVASGLQEPLDRARELWKRILTYYRYPALLPPKYIPGSKKSKAHNVRMCLVSVTQVLRDADPAHGAEYTAVIDEVIEELLRDFVQGEEGVLFEEVGLQGERIDSPSGRRINPGHAMETAWFLMMEAHRRADAALMQACIDITRASMALGWDNTYGGIYNYIDIGGFPSDKVEWDMKYWWTHGEAMNASLFAHLYTGDKDMAQVFDKVWAYTEAHFPDEECGEWYGYLHRDGSLCLDAKGGLFKGPFHIPRTLMYCLEALGEMEKG